MYKSRLKVLYQGKIVPGIMEKFGLVNRMQAPKLKKIVLNIGVSAAKEDIKILEEAKHELTLISGQSPVITRAKKSISNFKLREGMPIGCMVTLRDSRMYEFLDRMVNFALPRIRDFKGVSQKGFDKQGNFTLGLQDELIFPEINVNKITKPKGLSITIVTSGNPEQAMELLRMFGLPFSKNEKLRK